ncbi:relaxase/mobilization nuclease domain-containing protein [Asticcacaulis sp. W401b]|uniref:relaxase/mobilization nuclease domain-containing protein n=1 Tax=Asticcacaulis sp. W401b TaxID=3388666 RepID=UPI003970EB76
MVKISGGGNGMRQIKAHLDYISRNGEIELEDQDGLVTQSRRDVSDLRDSWQNGGYPVPEDGHFREAFNIVLSMPEGTNEQSLKRAARDFASELFPDHQYAMALHTFDTDPDPKPAKHPHVHLVVKARSHDGVRLNPRKADLQIWRESFARHLGEHGIEATATPRRLRQQGIQGVAIGVIKAASRSGVTMSPRVTPQRADPAFEAVLSALSRSEDREDRRLAEALTSRFSRDKGRGL